jgi:Fis family transcriptional regulator, factor for inversion stimulation protein
LGLAPQCAARRYSLEPQAHRRLHPGFKDLRGAEPHSVHDMVIKAVERPLLDVVMQHAEGNQSKAAEWLGINRNTLRRKLADHKLLK